MTNPTKVCPGCRVELPLDAYSPGNSQCRKCKAAYAVAKYRNNPEFRAAVRAKRKVDEARRRADPVINAKKLEAARKKYATNKQFRDKVRESARLGRVRFLGRDFVQQAKRRSKRDGRECSVTAEYVQGLWEADKHCGYCGVQLEIGKGEWSNISPSLDRIDPSGGYTPQNVIICCWRCNNLKRDATADEIEALAQNFRRVSAARRF